MNRKMSMYASVRAGAGQSSLAKLEYEQRRRELFDRGYRQVETPVVGLRDITQDIVTGIPPKFKPDALEEWRKRREEVAIERLFR